MRVDLVRPCRLKPGMLVAGIVKMDAPTTPVQPLAAALTVEAIELADAEGVHGFYIEWKRIGRSGWYPLYGRELSFLVIDGAQQQP